MDGSFFNLLGKGGPIHLISMTTVSGHEFYERLNGLKSQPNVQTGVYCPCCGAVVRCSHGTEQTCPTSGAEVRVYGNSLTVYFTGAGAELRTFGARLAEVRGEFSRDAKAILEKSLRDWRTQ